jgi:hypothetical protein
MKAISFIPELHVYASSGLVGIFSSKRKTPFLQKETILPSKKAPKLLSTPSNTRSVSSRYRGATFPTLADLKAVQKGSSGCRADHLLS